MPVWHRSYLASIDANERASVADRIDIRSGFSLNSMWCMRTASAMSASSTTPEVTCAVSTTIGQWASSARRRGDQLQRAGFADDPVDHEAVVVLGLRARHQVGRLEEWPGLVAARLEMGADRIREVLVVVEHGDDLADAVARLGLQPLDLVCRRFGGLCRQERRPSRRRADCDQRVGSGVVSDLAEPQAAAHARRAHLQRSGHRAGSRVEADHLRQGLAEQRADALQVLQAPCRGAGHPTMRLRVRQAQGVGKPRRLTVLRQTVTLHQRSDAAHGERQAVARGNVNIIRHCGRIRRSSGTGKCSRGWWRLSITCPRGYGRMSIEKPTIGAERCGEPRRPGTPRSSAIVSALIAVPSC